MKRLVKNLEEFRVSARAARTTRLMEGKVLFSGIPQIINDYAGSRSFVEVLD
jgi:hypothetical protein